MALTLGGHYGLIHICRAHPPINNSGGIIRRSTPGAGGDPSEGGQLERGAGPVHLGEGHK